MNGEVTTVHGDGAGQIPPDPPLSKGGTTRLMPSALLALAQHWPEYLMEAAGLGLFMVSACVFVLLLEHPASSVRHALDDAWLRRALIGLAMGLTAIALIYSPLGKGSGAHLNPSVTLTFLRLGKIEPWDAVFYIAAQFIGGAVGVLLVANVAGMMLIDSSRLPETFQSYTFHLPTFVKLKSRSCPSPTSRQVGDRWSSIFGSLKRRICASRSSSRPRAA